MMTAISEPTSEGLRRYPPDGMAEVEGGAIACACTEACAKECMGECGCQACRRVSLDYLHSGYATEVEIAEYARRAHLWLE